MKKVNSIVSLFCVLFYFKYNFLLINAQEVKNDQNIVSDYEKKSYCKDISKEDERYEMAENLIGEILEVLNRQENIKYILKEIICFEMSDNKNIRISTLFVWGKYTTNCRIRVHIRTLDNKVFISCQNGVEKTFINPHAQNRDSTKVYLYNSENLFHIYKKDYNKKYESSFENKRRYRIFKDNLHRIYKLNQMEMGSATYGITEFSDMTPLEFKNRAGLLPMQNNQNYIKNPIGEIPNFKLPKEFDWRKKNVVTQVKNQGNCGSCWAFSTIGNIESLHAIKTGFLEEYSEQELLDCDNVDNGCNGGLMDNAYKEIEKIGGLELESEYPYEAHRERCQFNRNLSHVKINGAVDLPQNETALALWLLANGPIAVGINANAMQFYRGGVSHPWHPLCRDSKIDHGVLIVGFGVVEYPVFNKTLPYWIVKNSWGSQWGEQGYYRVYRGDNTCGISSMASSAVL